MKQTSPLTINVAELRQRPLDVTLNEAPSWLDLDAPDVEFIGRVTGRLSWRWIDNRVVATGRALASAKAACVRCLADVSLNVSAEVRLVYESSAQRVSVGGGKTGLLLEEIESDTDDEGVIYYDGDWIDSREDVRAILLVELPDYPLCSPHCKGLCPQCGADLNHEACGCRPREEAREGDWKSQLDDLRRKL